MSPLGVKPSDLSHPLLPGRLHLRSRQELGVDLASKRSYSSKGGRCLSQHVNCFAFLFDGWYHSQGKWNKENLNFSCFYMWLLNLSLSSFLVPAPRASVLLLGQFVHALLLLTVLRLPSLAVGVFLKFGFCFWTLSTSCQQLPCASFLLDLLAGEQCLGSLARSTVQSLLGGQSFSYNIRSLTLNLLWLLSYCWNEYRYSDENFLLPHVFSFLYYHTFLWQVTPEIQGWANCYKKPGRELGSEKWSWKNLFSQFLCSIVV